MDARSIRDQAIKEAKCNLILDAARKVFATKGFHETRLEDIALESGFSKASLYNYYTDKDEIFMSLAARDFEDLFKTLIGSTNPSDPFFINLERLIRTSIAFFGDHFAFIVSTTNFYMMQKLNPEKLVRQHREITVKFRKHYDDILAHHTKLIGDAQRRGELSNSLPAASITRYISTLVRGIFIEWKLRGEKGDIERETSHLLTFIGNGIAQAGGVSSSPVPVESSIGGQGKRL